MVWQWSSCGFRGNVMHLIKYKQKREIKIYIYSLLAIFNFLGWNSLTYFTLPIYASRDRRIHRRINAHALHTEEGGRTEGAWCGLNSSQHSKRIVYCAGRVEIQIEIWKGWPFVREEKTRANDEGLTLETLDFTTNPFRIGSTAPTFLYFY